MFAAKKIISAKQMKTFRAKNSSVMKDLLAKGGGEILHRKIIQKEFWGAMREDSKSHEFGERSYTKKGLTTFMGKLLTNKADHLTDRKVKKLADMFEIKREKLYTAAAEARVEQSNLMAEKKQVEAQRHEQNQIEIQEHRQSENKIRDHISEIVSKGHAKARAALFVSSAVDQTTYAGNHNNSENGGSRLQDNAGNSFEISDKNLRNADNFLSHPVEVQKMQSNSNNFGQLMFLKNKRHNFVEEEKNEEEKIKARLARIQGGADNHDKDGEKNDFTS